MRWVAVQEWRSETLSLARSPPCVVYASFEHRRDFVAAAVDGAHAANAAPLNGSQPAEQPPFQMSRGLAWALARRNIEAACAAKATAALRASSGANDVRELECEVSVLRVAATPLRLPAYLLSYAHGTTLSDDQSIVAERFSAVVGGASGGVGAEELLSPHKAQLAATAPLLAAGALAELLSSASSSLGLELAFLAAVAGVLARVAARRLPYNRYTAAEAARLRECDAWEALRGGASTGAGAWVDERVQRARDAAEWRRWEETGLWRWDAARRAVWATNLWRAQVERARGRRRWHAERAEAVRFAEEAARRTAAKQARWGDDWAAGSAAAAAVAGPPRDPKGFYRLLGLSERVGLATDEEIKAAYRREALRIHPDTKQGDTQAAAEAFRELQAAYTVLRDPRQRAIYCNHSQ